MYFERTESAIAAKCQQINRPHVTVDIAITNISKFQMVFKIIVHVAVIKIILYCFKRNLQTLLHCLQEEKVTDKRILDLKKNVPPGITGLPSVNGELTRHVVPDEM